MNEINHWLIVPEQPDSDVGDFPSNAELWYDMIRHQISMFHLLQSFEHQTCPFLNHVSNNGFSIRLLTLLDLRDCQTAYGSNIEIWHGWLEFIDLIFQDYKSNKQFDPNRTANLNLRSFRLPYLFLAKNRWLVATPGHNDFFFNESWLRDASRLFSRFTELSMVIDEVQYKPINRTDFLFDYQNQRTVFIGFHKLRRSHSNQSEITERNINAFKTLIEDMSYLRTYENSKDFSAMRRLETLQNELSRERIQDFQALQDLISTYSTGEKVKPKNIGVFLDTANTLRFTHAVRVDFQQVIHHILKQLYRERRRYKILWQQAVLFEPKFEDDDRQFQALEYLETMKTYLKEQGFSLLESSNDHTKAKIIIENEEFDCDDQLLIQSIRNKTNQLDGIILFTGDGHFVEILEQCLRQGLEIVVVTPPDEETSNRIIHMSANQYKRCKLEDFIQFHYLAKGARIH